ncbi:MAG: hypothetical protein ACTSYQ_04795 [Candidatus Odinarchaeia archaeon]
MPLKLYYDIDNLTRDQIECLKNKLDLVEREVGSSIILRSRDRKVRIDITPEKKSDLKLFYKISVTLLVDSYKELIFECLGLADNARTIKPSLLDFSSKIVGFKGKLTKEELINHLIKYFNLNEDEIVSYFNKILEFTDIGKPSEVILKAAEVLKNII